MDYHGTDGNDTIDQSALGIASGTNIFGGKGDDSLTVADGNAIGEAGNDTITAKNVWVTAAYWNSPAAVKVNLATGTAQDGYGGTDTLINVHSVADSGYNDELTGSSGNDTFWLSWGSDKVIGGGGIDTVKMYDARSTDTAISYDKASDTFTVRKNMPNGDKGVLTLQGVNAISFTGPNSDNVTVTRDMYDDSQGFLRAKTYLPSFDMGKVQQLRAGDFNGDGKTDVLIVRANADVGLTAEPLQVLLGDGQGHFTDGTASVFGAGIPKVNFVPRIFTADFNKDGVSDIFNPDFGVDAPPFPGGQNSYYLSNPATGKLESATSTLPQRLAQNHGTSIGDVNKDGYLDLLVNALNDSTGNANQLLINDGTGHFTASPSLLPASLRPSGFDPGNTWSMLRDLNNDGYDDMVLGTWDPSPYPSRVLLNDGHGSFATSTPIELPRSGVPKDIVIGIETIDLNGDALPDLIQSVTNGGAHGEFYKTPYLQLLVNDGNGHFHDETAQRLPQSTTPTGATEWYLSATAVDVNGDGFQDIVVDGTAGATSRIYMNNGAGQFSMGWESAVGSHILATDVNGDGKPDLVEASSAGYSVLSNVFPTAIPASHEYRAGDGGERIAGGAAGETVYSGKGNDTVDGGGGMDRLVLDGKRSDYTISKNGSGFTVADKHGVDGTDTLSNVERLTFTDISIALDGDGTPGQLFRLYQAVLNRPSDAIGMGFWMQKMADGKQLVDIAAGFMDAPEFRDLYGASPSYRDIVSKLYVNVLHRQGAEFEVQYWVDKLNGGQSAAQVVMSFSESAENQANTAALIAQGIEYIPYL
ncbi:FG-GAP-like repeat-containing protein [Massilia endophytica]|uniref:FG-GAP-like repeat-containing protein n=1 Tax=Massilia endophytica TaxID=2899220 RepID=UPI001E391336|nr:FG-GAP-like repeat-containing protein [Massilia endophytica]UGQ47482.1 FG-GAP-like repeat-containing protein [Massilia endophytica]